MPSLLLIKNIVNSALFRKMRDELDHEYGGRDKCPWSAVVLIGTKLYV